MIYDVVVVVFLHFGLCVEKSKVLPKILQDIYYLIHKCIHLIIYFSHIPTAQLPVAADHSCVPSLRHALDSCRTGISINNRENIKY